MPDRHGSKRRRHRHSPGRRLMRRLRRHRWVLPMLLILLAAVVVTGVWMWQDARGQRSHRVTATSQSNVGGNYRNISYKGKEYRYNSRITAILFAGVDSHDPLEAQKVYGNAPLADSMSLVVLDEYHRRMTIIALNRDTMTPIHKYTLRGKDMGMVEDHLCFAYTYGDGAEVSARNVCDAVSNLLYGVPVHDFIVTNFDSIPLLGDAIGPVRVKVPNDDLTALGYLKGETVEIDGSNLEQFVRTRDIHADFSNVSRMERQQAYINGAVGRIRRSLEDDPSGTWQIVERAEKCICTSITRNHYLDLIETLGNTAYDAGNYYIPEGRQIVGRVYEEFYPDEEALLQKVVEIFYIEK